MNKQELCKQIKEMKEGLHLLDSTVERIKNKMLSWAMNSIQITEGYEPHLHYDLERYPKLLEKLQEIGFTIKTTSVLVGTSKSEHQELTATFFFGYFKRYKTIEKQTDHFSNIYEISICCEDE